MIPFNKPCLTGDEMLYIQEAVASGKISGNGRFTQKSQKLLEGKYGFRKCLLTSSCTDALEMCAILLNIKPGDEVIVPSFTFVSTALAFVRQGAVIVFADSHKDHPGLNEDHVESLITPKTRAIVPVHYRGTACKMDKIMEIASKHGLYVVEDAAQSIDGYFLPGDGVRQPLGSIGHLGCFSFHETKNVQCGEGGCLTINDEHFIKRAEIIWEKGTDRAAFFRGEKDKYGWEDTGSSFLPSEITAAFLFAQLEETDKITEKRLKLWHTYQDLLKPVAEQGCFSMPVIPPYSTNNGHIFYIVCNSPEDRTNLIDYLHKNGIIAVFHYQSLHKSNFYRKKYKGFDLPNADRFSECLLRLPIYLELTVEEVEDICLNISNFYRF